MDTAHATHRTGPAFALLLGAALALAPVSAHAFASAEADVPSEVTLRQLIEADRPTDAERSPTGVEPGATVRQLIEADRVPASVDAPAVAPGATMRQLIEADRPAAPRSEIRPNLRQLMEADRVAASPRLGIMRR